LFVYLLLQYLKLILFTLFTWIDLNIGTYQRLDMGFGLDLLNTYKS
jgi:hypothetical protein